MPTVRINVVAFTPRRRRGTDLRGDRPPRIGARYGGPPRADSGAEEMLEQDMHIHGYKENNVLFQEAEELFDAE
ncbi:hypothetical protein [Natronorubrum sp. FCH18a]|uniref:hypothetical protein n=1 Tax=Natronorubrum sp. FCH18a TaxID=3447018 RepID=UPI003F519CC0